MFEKFFNLKCKKYDLFLPIGSRIEFTNKLFEKYHFYQRSLLFLSKFGSIDCLLKLLLNPKSLLKEDFEYQNGYFIGKNTGLMFLQSREPIEKSDDEDLYNIQIEDAKTDFKDLIEFLLYTMKKILQDDKNKVLYIYTVSESDFQDSDIKNKIIKLNQILKKVSLFKYDLLVIAKKQYQNLFNFEQDNLYIRFIEKFSDSENYKEDNGNNKKDWDKILNEFVLKDKHLKPTGNNK